VVRDSPLPRYKREQQAFRALCGIGIAKDVLVFAREELERGLAVAPAPVTHERGARRMHGRRPVRRKIPVQRTIVIEYPEAISAVSNQSPEAFEQEARKAMSVKLYEMGRLSSGHAAQLAGIGRVELLLTCIDMGVSSVEWDDDEISREFQ